MGSGFFALYTSCTADNFDLDYWTQLFASRAMGLALPSSGKLFRIGDEEDGEAKIGEALELEDYQQLVLELTRRRRVSFQWWLTDAQDVFCTLRRVAAQLLIEFNLGWNTDGITALTIATAAQGAHYLSRRSLLNGAVAFLRDRSYSEEWEPVFYRGTDADAIAARDTPELVWLPKLSKEQSPWAREFAREFEIGEHLVYSDLPESEYRHVHSFLSILQRTR